MAYIPGYGPDKHQRLSLASIQVGLKNTWIAFIRVGLKNTRLSRLCREELVHETSVMDRKVVLRRRRTADACKQMPRCELNNSQKPF